MRTLMLGWEFPPYISGGLGTACYGLTKAMDRLGMQVVFVMPHAAPIRFGNAAASAENDPVHKMFSENVRLIPVASELMPYDPFLAAGGNLQSRSLWTDFLSGPSDAGVDDINANYGPDVFSSVRQFTDKVLKIARRERFDIVHAHDWMTFPAAGAIASASGRPFVAHVHSTEFDRSGEHVHQAIYDVERRGMHAAKRVVAVSNYTRNIILTRYGVPGEKVDVVHNGVDFEPIGESLHCPRFQFRRDKIVLFLGRITMQKGPEYFLHAAKMVLDKMDRVKFIMAGAGDLLHSSIELAAHLKIGHKVLFTRFLRGADVHRAYRLADLYVMPSVSEPFGIAPLEALRHRVPVLISKQSGVSETLRHALKVDFWDVHQMADKIVSVLRRPPLHRMLRDSGSAESERFRWEDAAAKISRIYLKSIA